MIDQQVLLTAKPALLLIVLSSLASHCEGVCLFETASHGVQAGPELEI